MTLDGPIRGAETARIELTKVANSSDGWVDGQRQEFDSERMKPLLEAGMHLLNALRKAQHGTGAAERLLSE